MGSLFIEPLEAIGRGSDSLVETDGFLGLDTRLSWHGGYSDTEGRQTLNNTFGISLGIIGSTNLYQLTTRLNFISNLFQVSEHYDGSSQYLAEGEIDTFSYFSLNVQYSMWRNDYLNFLMGYGLGHLGYISSEFATNPFSLYVSAISSLQLFLYEYFGFFIEVELPFGIFRRNTLRVWHFRLKNEIVYEPEGNISNPLPTSFFIALGWQFDYVYLVPKDTERDSRVVMIRPYIRFTYLY